MKITKINKIILLTIITMLITLGLTAISTKANAASVYLGLEAYRSGYSYKSLDDKIMWKISTYTSPSGAGMSQLRAIYCIKGGPGFGSADDMGKNPQIKEYTRDYDLKNVGSIDEPYKSKLPTGQAYNSLIWVLEHCYVPAQNANETETVRAFRNQLLANAGIPNSKITDAEIDIVQQLAVWYFTNADPNTSDTSYQVKNESFSFWIKQIADADYEPIGDKLGDPGYDREDDAKELFSYFINNAKNAGAPSANTNIITVEQNRAVARRLGDNYVVGPYKINKTGTETDYDLSIALKAANNSNLTYKLLNSSKQEVAASNIKSLVGQDFYLSISNTQNITGAKIEITSGVYQTDIRYRSVEGAGAAEQPVAEVIRNKKPKTIEINIVLSEFDLALRKFITKINNVDVPTREPVVGAMTATNGTTAVKPHRKDALTVKPKDTVLYTIRVYNEGKIDGYAKQITDYLPTGLRLKPNSKINTDNGWTNPSGDGRTIVTEKLGNVLLNKNNGTTIASADVQIECEVTAEYATSDVKLRNVAEITRHSDEQGNTNIVDRDSIPNNLTNDQKTNYNPGTSTQGWGYQDDDDFEDLVLPKKAYDFALRKFITKINDKPVTVSREPVIGAMTGTNGTTLVKTHTKKPLPVETGDTVLYTIRVYNEGDLAGQIKEITDYLPAGLKLKEGSTINATNGWTSTDGKTIKTTKTAGTILEAFTGTTPSSVDVQIECEVIEEATTVEKKLKNVAEITKHADKNGNENITDRDSTPNNLTEDQKSKYNPGTSEQGWGYEDDDDYEDLILPAKKFDLALRKFITNVNGRELVDSNGKYLREPTIDVTKLANGTSTTAEYKHRKDPVGVAVGNIVIYTLRVYNEGELDGYANSVTDYLPPQLEFVIDDEEQFNAKYGWVIDSSLRKATTRYLSKGRDAEENLMKAFDPDTMTQPDYKELKIKCRVKSVEDLQRVITNVAEITEYSDRQGNITIIDRDSTADSLTNDNSKPEDDIANDNLPTDDELPDYKGNDSNKSILTDKEYFYKGQQDDDDFEKLILEEFDLALRKFITGVNDKKVTNRVPQFTTNKDENGNYIYEHTKEPVEVETTDIVEYTIRIFNEGDISGYAKEVKDNIPSGLEFLPNNDLNKEYR